MDVVKILQERAFSLLEKGMKLRTWSNLQYSWRQCSFFLIFLCLPRQQMVPLEEVPIAIY